MITHIGSPRGHEDGKVCEVIAGAGGCIAVDVDGLAAVSGPVAPQALRLVLPESTHSHISCRVDGLQERERNKTLITVHGAVRYSFVFYAVRWHHNGGVENRLYINYHTCKVQMHQTWYLEGYFSVIFMFKKSKQMFCFVCIGFSYNSYCFTILWLIIRTISCHIIIMHHFGSKLHRGQVVKCSHVLQLTVLWNKNLHEHIENRGKTISINCCCLI